MAIAKKLNWLEEVKADAKFNYMRRLREEEEKKRHEAEKQELAKKLQAERAEPKKGK